MIRNFLMIFTAVSFVFYFVIMASAQDIVLSGNLVEQSKFYDNKIIRFRGEVIGEVMFRGDHAWLNVNDDNYSTGSRRIAGYNSGQSVWVKTGDAKMIKTCGDYFHVGDNIEVIGIFHRACPEHGGDMDIHAEKITLLIPGGKIDRPLKLWKAMMAIFLFIGTAVLFLIHR